MTREQQPGSVPKPGLGVVDPRQPRFGAAITSVLLLIGVYLALVGNSVDGSLPRVTVAERLNDPAVWVLLGVASLFAWTFVSPRTHPFSALYRRVVLPRVGAPAEWEDARPPRFAQGVGLTVVGVGLLLHLFGVPWALVIAGAVAFVAAFLNAAIGFCLGCELYLLLVRLRPAARG